MDEAVIAFRGTENSTLNESLEDWASNVAAAIGIEPPQFITAQRLIPGLIDGLVLQSPRIRIFATGHSLGGGLAQQAGYISEHILEVYTFDTSPVTNWSFLMLHKAVRQTDPKIFRVYHWHEGLAYVRNISSRFETRRFGRSDYEFYFQQVSPIAAHEMGILACHLSKIVQGPEADHYYPREYAEAVISPSYRLPEHYAHPVCPPTVSLREP